MTDFLLLSFVFLAAGIASVPIASLFGLGSVLGYLIAGVLISPVLTLLKVDVISIQSFAELGVVMMLFLVGLELEPKKLWQMKFKLLGIGGGQILLSTAALTAFFVLLGHQPLSVSLACGLIFALSSTAIVLQTLNEKGLMNTEGGQSTFAVLLTQDIAAIPMLAFIPLLAMPELIEAGQHAAGSGGEGHGGHGGEMSLIDGLAGWQTALVDLLAIAGVLVGGKFLTTPVFRYIGLAGLRELFIAATLLFVFGIALIMHLVGLSPALGTFLAGVVLANSPYRHEIESNLDPFKSLLLGLFFITVGASINFALLFNEFFAIIALTLGFMLVKGLVLLLLAYIFKLHTLDKWLFALGLSQAGEFGFVLLALTLSSGVLPVELVQQLTLAIAISMVLTPLLFIFYDKVIAAKDCHEQTERKADEITEENKIIIVGAGRVGGVINRVLRLAGYETTIIDYNSKHLVMLEKFGIRCYYGDATRPELLESAGIADAKVLIVAIDNKDSINKIVKQVMRDYPNVHVIARAVDRHHVYDLWAHGCRDIIRETFDSSLRMGRSALESMGISRDASNEIIKIFSDIDQQRMINAADKYRTDVAPHENTEYINHVRTIMQQGDPRAEQTIKDIIQGQSGV